MENEGAVANPEHAAIGTTHGAGHMARKATIETGVFGKKKENAVATNNQCTGGFSCECSICKSQIRIEKRSTVAATTKAQQENEINELLYEGIPRDFFWLMHSLLASSDKVKGCELIFPDTAFFRKGKPVIVIKSDSKDYCLVGVRHPKKLSLQSIYKDFQNVVRRRKKDLLGPFNRFYFNN